MDVQAGSPFPQIPGGRYHIIERLSAGAIGAVYKALDTILDRPVAVKCIHLDTPFADQSPDELRERFVREARIAARLQHPNIVTIHDIVATSDRGFIIMEFIEGMPLESLIAERKRLSMPEAIRVASQLASALDYAHSRNVIHRDVKPVNILVSPSLWVWVTDFGIAKSELSTNLTMAGGVLGTPDYMSPEQAKGEDVDARSDLFSLGCILFECVTGEKPFPSPSLTGVLLSIINDEPVFPLDWTSLGLPNGLKPVLHHALEKDRVKRYPSGAEMVKALEALDAPAMTVAPPEDVDSTDPVVETLSRESSPGPTEEASSRVFAGPSDVAAPSEPELDRHREPEAEVEAVREQESHTEEPSSAHESPERTMMFSAGEAPVPPPSSLIDPARIEELKEESHPLRLSPNLSGELQGAAISPEEGFLLSRIDGHSRARDILAMSPMSEAETAAALLNLLDKALIQLGGPAPARQRAKEREPSVPKGTPDEATARELDRLLSLAKSHAYADLLGVAQDAPSGARKSAYLRIISKFHPDKFPRAADEIREKLSRLCAEAAEAMEQLAHSAASKPSNPAPTNGASFEGASSSFARAASGPSFDKRRYARDLYDRALRAFDTMDFWESIQLCRQALETDDTQAEYFHLLGRALMQNKRWRKEAADNFRRASELAPANLAYLGMLGAVYKAEGLQARANAILMQAKSLDPSFTLPEIDGEASVEAG
ncbi:MAG: protein kinase domain-containing protein [Vicinamibacteria bacterium]